MVYNQPCQPLFSFFYALAGHIYILTKPCHVGMEGFLDKLIQLSWRQSIL